MLPTDYVEGSGTMHEIFNYTLASYSSTEVHLHREYINSTSDLPQIFQLVDLYLSIPPGSFARLSVLPNDNGTITSPTIDILLPTTINIPGGEHATAGNPTRPANETDRIRIRVVTSETTLAGLSPDNLFLSPQDASTPPISSALAALATNISEQVRIYGVNDSERDANNVIGFVPCI